MDDFGQDERRALDASEGGKARAKSLRAEERREIARKAARARWAKIKREKGIVTEEDKQAFVRTENNENIRVSGNLGQASARTDQLETPKLFAMYTGTLEAFGSVSCYVLNDETRVLGRTTANEMLTGIKRSGDIERTIGVLSLRPFLDFESTVKQFIPFRTTEAERLNTHAKGIPTDLFIEICRAFVTALEASYNRPDSADYPELTDKQKEIAIRASLFLGAVAKVGLDALVDEATGYQQIRDKNALEVKLRAYLADEMRKWEKTFPDELWAEFGRLTNWEGSLHRRPKYWGKLVMELIYEYLDPDVAQWLKDNAPKPRHGRNYFQWLSDQYGLQKLLEHIYKVIGMAKTCNDMAELRQLMNHHFGNEPLQLTFKLPRQ